MAKTDRVGVGIRLSPDALKKLAAIQAHNAEVAGVRAYSQSDAVERLIQEAHKAIPGKRGSK